MNPALLVRPQSNNFEYTWEHVEQVVEYPHILGHIAGRTKLTDLHSSWTRYMWDTDEDRALQAHRGSFKTTSVIVIGAIRWMLLHPDDRIGIIRKTFTDAAEIVDTIKAIMKMPEVRALFKVAHGHLPIAIKDRQGFAQYNFKNTVTPEGNLNAYGLDGSLTGKHLDKIMCDDFVTLKDRTSRAERKKTIEIVQEIATNIIDPGKAVGWLGTPWHREDAWTVIPCTPLKFPLEACNLLSEEEIARKRLTTTPFLFNINYNLTLEGAEGKLFGEPVYKMWDYTFPGALAHVDAAFDGDHFCAMTILAPKPPGGYQGIGFSYAGNVKDWLPFIVKKYKQYRCMMLYNETNPDKGYTADALKALGLRVKTYSEGGNKHAKISTHGYEAWPSTTWDFATDPEYISQALDYQEGVEPDDAPDSFASLQREGFPATKKTASSLWRA